MTTHRFTQADLDNLATLFVAAYIPIKKMFNLGTIPMGKLRQLVYVYCSNNGQGSLSGEEFERILEMISETIPVIIENIHDNTSTKH